MKIGIIQSVIGGGGGNDRVLFSLLEKLEKTEHVVNIYTIGQPLSNLKNYKVTKVKKLFPIKLPIFGIYQKMLEPMLAKKAQHEDVLVALTGDLFLPSNKKQRMIFYSQNNYSDPAKMNTSKYKTGFWKLYYAPYKKQIAKLMKGIGKYNIKFVANSKYVADQLKNGLKADAKVVYPPVDIREFYNDTKDKSGIMTVTRFSKEKNLEKIVEIIGDYDTEKRIFGSVSQINKPYMNDIIRKGKEKNIKFDINQPREHMKKLLSKSKYFISASDETFGIAIVEAIASGCIPFVPNSTAHKETVPFPALRFDDDNSKEKLDKLMEYGFPRMKELQEHIKKFDEPIFQENMLRLIEE